MNVQALPAVIVLGILFLRGCIATVRLRAEYRSIRDELVPRYRAIGRAFVIVAATIVLALGWFAFITLRRLLGLLPSDGLAVISFFVLLPTLLLPDYLWIVWHRIGTDPAGRKRKR